MELTRSQIHRSINQAMEIFDRFGVRLPSFAFWTVADWAEKGVETAEIRDCHLGWDVTDFGSKDFIHIGRTLFTLRNGSKHHPDYPKSYAQKLLFNPESQRAPAHFHLSKMEDIFNLAGGNMLVQLTAATADNQPSTQSLRIQVDGQTREVAPGGIVRLEPGQSVCIPPRTIHQFWGEEGTGVTVSSEISSVCDDLEDNYFLNAAQRFPQIVEDEPRRHYLVNEYPSLHHESA